ncbi:MAG TPA: hypothetical protein VH351_05775 [Bryobacteraceae bacterium]|jgi:hypothetical protein|nr:hypothetical protein [Bryobacteraceae bacterium]
MAESCPHFDKTLGMKEELSRRDLLDGKCCEPEDEGTRGVGYRSSGGDADAEETGDERDLPCNVALRQHLTCPLRIRFTVSIPWFVRHAE